MKVRSLIMAMALMLVPVAAQAQQAVVEQPAPAAQPSSLRDKLMPQAEAAALVAPVITEKEAARDAAQPAMASRGAGVAYMLAGAALFVAGLIVEGDAGTVMLLAGAGIGAYGIYIHFR